MTTVNPLSAFKSLVADEATDPDLQLLLRAMSADFRGVGAWSNVVMECERFSRALQSDDLEGVVGTLFRSGRLNGDRENYDDPRNSFLDHCLTTGTGLPITLCLIARFVAELRSVNCALIGLPGHVVIGDDISDESLRNGRRFFDPFNGGRELSKVECLNIAAMAGNATSEDVLAPMTSRGIVIRILNNLARTYQRRRDTVSLSRVVAYRWAMPEIRRLDEKGTLSMVKEMN